MVNILETESAVRQAVVQARRAGRRIGFVPTMGALHAGHASLMRAARQHCESVIVSIFVNPLQFGPHEDFARYPRPLEQDRALLAQEGVDMLYLPQPAAMYPPGFATTVSVAGLSDGLCGAARPGHFDGVATVVAKLLLQTQPDLAFFGEKDYQQLQIIRRMTADLSLPVEIIGVPTARAADGLALSSRNAYLSEQERAIAPRLYETLMRAAQRLATEPVEQVLEWAQRHLQDAGFGRIDYIACCDASTLAPLSQLDAPARLLAAAWLGQTRLIDNIAVEV